MAHFFRIGSRSSRLATKQAQWVGDRLRAAGHQVAYEKIRSHGEQHPDAPFSQISMQGIFTKALEEALAQKQIDLAVHSAKDLPALTPKSFDLVAFTERLPVHDVLLASPGGTGGTGGSWYDGIKTSRIGTSSVRRTAQLLAHFPKIEILPLRGNIDTRLEALSTGRFDAIVLAYAAIHRSDRAHLVTQSLHPLHFVPAVGQGALAIEVRQDMAPHQRQALRQALNHPLSERALHAERSFLAHFGGGCQESTFGLATIDKKVIHLHAGCYYQGKCLEHKQHGTEPLALGRAVAEILLQKRST